MNGKRFYLLGQSVVKHLLMSGIFLIFLCDTCLRIWISNIKIASQSVVDSFAINKQTKGILFH